MSGGADTTATWTVNVDANRSSSDGLADSLSALKQKLLEDTKALNEMQAALKRLQQGASVDISAVRKLQDQITGKKAEIASAQTNFINLGGVFGEVVPKAEASEKALGGMFETMTAGGGTVGSLAGKAKLLTENLGKLGVAGVAIIAAVAVVLLVSAIGIAIYKLAEFALGAADASRSAMLLHEAASGSASGARVLEDAVSAVSARVKTARADIEKMADDLAKAGLAGGALKDALMAMGLAGAVAGSQAQSALEGIIKKAQEAGKLVLSETDLKNTGLGLEDVGAALAKKLGITTAQAVAALKSGALKLEDGIAAIRGAAEAKFGSIAARQLLSMDVQLAKAKERLDRLFVGVKIEPFLKGLADVLSLLDENTVTGQALKALFETMLNPLFESVGKISPMVKESFKGFLIIVLMAAIGILKVKNALSDLIGLAPGLDGMKVALYLGYGAAILVGSALAALVILLGLVLLAGLLIAAPFILAGLAVAAIVYAGYRLMAWLTELQGAAEAAAIGLAASFLGAASAIVSGFVGKLMYAGGAVADAARGLAMSALNAIKGVLGIASPSKEMAKLAGFSVAGFVGRLKDGEDEVTSATEALVRLPADAPAAGGSTASASTKTGRGDINVTIIAQGVKDADSLKGRSFLDTLIDCIETAAGQGGAPVLREVKV